MEDMEVADIVEALGVDVRCSWRQLQGRWLHEARGRCLLDLGRAGIRSGHPTSRRISLARRRLLRLLRSDDLHKLVKLLMEARALLVLLAGTLATITVPTTT